MRGWQHYCPAAVQPLSREQTKQQFPARTASPLLFVLPLVENCQVAASAASVLGVFSSCFTDLLYPLLASSSGAFSGRRLPAFITATRSLNGYKMLLIGIWQMDVRSSGVKTTASSCAARSLAANLRQGSLLVPASVNRLILSCSSVLILDPVSPV